MGEKRGECGQHQRNELGRECAEWQCGPFSYWSITCNVLKYLSWKSCLFVRKLIIYL